MVSAVVYIYLKTEIEICVHYRVISELRASVWKPGPHPLSKPPDWLLSRKGAQQKRKMASVSYLRQNERERYAEKIGEINNQDPYTIQNMSSNADLLPGVTYPDIYNYLIQNKSAYTSEQLKAYKGLD